MTITYPTDLEIDSATKARTEQFFNLLTKKPNDDFLLDYIRRGICLEAIYKGQGTAGTPLQYAVWHSSNVKIIRALAAAGANIHVRREDSQTLLWDALFFGKNELVPELLALGINPNISGFDGSTALHLAKTRQSIEDLLAAGAYIEARNDKGETPLFRHVGNGNNPLSWALISKGANLYVLNKSSEGIIAHPTLVGHDDREYEIKRMQIYYARFIATHSPPIDTKHIYQLLAVTPLADPKAPVDYAGNVRKIFLHAKWKNKAQAAGILEEMKKDGTISAETAESILAATFPPKLLRPLLAYLPPTVAGMMR